MQKIKYILLGLSCAVLLSYAVAYVYERNSGEAENPDSNTSARSVCIYENSNYTVIDAEEYVTEVLAGMLNKNWNDEMMKTVAVLIRTGIYYQMESQADSSGGSGHGLINESALREIRYSDEELEQIWGTAYNDIKERAQSAVSATSGQVMTYGGEIIVPAYHLVSTGHTVSAEEIYGHDIPYLKQVDSNVDTMAENFSTTTVYSADRMRKTFQTWIDVAGADNSAGTAGGEDAAGADDPAGSEDAVGAGDSAESEGAEGNTVSDDSAVRVTKATQSGFAQTIYVFGAEIDADTFKTQLGLQSTNIHIDRVEDGYRVITIGVGDSLGLSLYGASVLAQNGKKYDEILKYYYTGIDISTEVR